MQNQWAKRTAIFLIGQTMTLFGSSVVQFAISWHITLTTKSGIMLTIATLCGFLPQVFISLFAGVWADRFDRKRLIIIADAFIAVFTLFLAILFMYGYTEIWPLFLISIVRSLGGGIQTPAVGALLPDIVPEEKLMRVNGINSSMQGLTMLLAPAVAGALYASLGLSAVFWIDVITAGLAISVLLVLKIEPKAKSEDMPENFIKDMFLGVKYVAKTKWLRQIMSFNLVFVLTVGPVVFLTPLMIARSFGEEPWRLAAHEMVFSVGSIAGGILAGVIGAKAKNKIYMTLFSAGLFGLITVVLGLSPNFWFYLGFMLPLGVVLPIMNTGILTIFQTRVAPELIGRVFGLVSIIGSGAMPLSMLVFGPLADAVSVELQLVATGVLMILICVFYSRFEEMKGAGEPFKNDEGSAQI